MTELKPKGMSMLDYGQLWVMIIAAFGIFCVGGSAQAKVDRTKLANEVKTEFLHAWNGYKKHAWGNDDLKPLSKSFHNWYPQPLLMTPVDGLDTMYMMGLKTEADATRKYITANLNFDKDIKVQKFEIVIRLLGGMLSAYQLPGTRSCWISGRSWQTASTRVESPTGLPYKYVNLKTVP